ncbi:MAG: tripartite tricarboxylate transporter TctB family protein [Hydrogenophaga sp.]|uniref:tripartite tricarboxylate transporter TctB family protein n=1 Tax=Hydrogenophaga sp. TaxID=1904254 RepID=UPI001DD0BB0C|nr:tripartite tricarboxylate transporter TctB family protein [Hydrogenophaga sp.]MBX3611387.1 tripartite tricarboxylate transporter TctB family protein [Hydrogenophaga sp.]
MKIASQKDFLSGIMFMAVGIAFALGARNFDIGEAARMGPGYFPFMLGILLAVLGVVITLQGVRGSPRAGEDIGTLSWRPLLFILGANLAFGALLVGVPALGIPAFGLIVALYALVIISGYARPDHRLKESIVLATILAVGSYVAFVYALRLQFPVLPWFLQP